MGTLEFSEKDFFDSGADILVNPVATDGHGITPLYRQFSKRFPINDETLKKNSKEKKLKAGRPLSTTEGDMFNAWHIMNLPLTQNHDSHPTEIEIKTALLAAANTSALYKAKSISFPLPRSWKINEEFFISEADSAFKSQNIKVYIHRLK